ncbi:hypothetical protein IDH44_00360 [Paenibacillus sp. IB182496]|uniref:Uncharacterized protein n=1 Tax=Paenibacillus sabuli TaxID=2772509 RepID=A0A927BN84_9BACL|nr:hypothetical protein [Paenibacillus sabuli]MBD2843626.1 hypothetical protein [Paenibacillus sabuli]
MICTDELTVIEVDGQPLAALADRLRVPEPAASIPPDAPEHCPACQAGVTAATEVCPDCGLTLTDLQ